MNFDKLTSEEMDSLLQRLGFRLQPFDGPQRIFENPEYDAMLFLPPAGKEPFARYSHVQTLRKTVDERGIVDMETFEKLLDEVRQQDTESLVKAS